MEMSGLDIAIDGKTTIFTFNRPGKANAINAEVADKLQKGFVEFDASDQKIAIITGAGKNFCGGADLIDPPVLWKVLPTIGIRTEKPIICAVNGACIGGAVALAAMSDLCIATENARFHYPEGKFGLTGGMIATLAARIPHKLAMEIMLLGQPVSGRRAYEMGLVNRVVPDGQHLEVARSIAHDMESIAPLVLKTLKRLVTEHTLVQTPSERMARAQRDLEIVNHSQDFAEGITSFKEKRPAVFVGR
jgi:enoyl-CoA hydratase